MRSSCVAIALLACACGIDAVGLLPRTAPATDEPVSGGDGSAAPPDGPDAADGGAGTLVDGPTPSNPHLDLTATVRAQGTATIDLTPIGTRDWAYWPGTTPVRHASGGQAIGSYEVVQGSPSILGKSAFSDTWFTWTNGTSAAPDGGSNAYLLFENADDTIVRLTLDATQPRTLVLYAACWEADCELAASLSDGSAPAKTDPRSIDLGGIPLVYEIAFQAAAPASKLFVDWKMKKRNDSDGALVIVAAALR